MGLLPHTSPTEVYASEYYKQDFLRYGERLGVRGMEFRRLLPSIFLPTFLQAPARLPHPRARLDAGAQPSTPSINRDFDTYELMPAHNDMAAMLDELHFDERACRRSICSTSARRTTPTRCPDEDPSNWPRISGVHGVFKHLGDGRRGPEATRVLRSNRACASSALAKSRP